MVQELEITLDTTHNITKLVDMKVYRIRLKGTNLHYQPVRTSYGQGTNLALLGKVYLNKPTLKHICMVEVQDTLIKMWDLKTTNPTISYRSRFLSDEYEFEIVEYNCVEVLN